MPPDPAILLENVSLTLESTAGGVNILRGVDLRVEKGETVAIVGPSGSGKTSLIMVIAGLEKPTSGRVCVAGADITALNEDKMAAFRRDHISLVFQSFHLIPTMTALENVAVPLELAGQRDAFATAKDALASVGLAERLLHYPAQLSGGEQQRVAIARAFVMKPELLMADEPTGNLDHETGEHITHLLFNLHRQHGTTLLLITHDRQLAARCGHLVTMMDGQVSSAQKPGDV